MCRPKANSTSFHVLLHCPRDRVTTSVTVFEVPSLMNQVFMLHLFSTTVESGSMGVVILSGPAPSALQTLRSVFLQV